MEKALEAARAEAERYADVFHHASVGIVIWHREDPADPESFRLVLANRAAALAVGNTLTSDVGRLVRDLPPARRPRVLDDWVATLADGAPRAWSSVRGDDPATQKFFEAQCFALPGDYLGVVFEDVTAQRHLTARVERQVRELERSNRELDDFAYITSHDLKSPLRDVRNLVSWITEDVGGALPPASAQHLKLVSDRVQRMEQLLDDLLEYSRVGRAADEARTFTVRAALDDVLALAALPPGFTAEFAGDDVTLHTPRAPFEKVLRNLVGNAVKHHDRAGGSVVVSAAVVGDRAEVRVRDDGPGIAPEFHQRVFRMFQTLRPRDEVEGSGVGLAIVKKSVEMMQGAVRVESAGRGTTVVFTWPLRRAATGG